MPRGRPQWLRQVVVSEGYGHGGPGVCLGDGQTEGEEVPSQGERGDALLRRMPPYLTYNSKLRIIRIYWDVTIIRITRKKCIGFGQFDQQIRLHYAEFSVKLWNNGIDMKHLEN